MPEEDVEATQEDAVSQDKDQVEEAYTGSLFSFNFLNEEGQLTPSKGVDEQKLDEQNNFHNFFITNDKIFGSPTPSPDVSA